MRPFVLTVLVAIGSPSPVQADLAQNKSLSLSQFLAEVHSSSPDLRVEKANVLAAEARASSLRLPPPMVGFMRMKEQGQESSGYEIAQEIPFPTKIAQEKKVRNLERDSQKESGSFQNAVILSQARTAYVAFWNAHTRLDLLKEKLKWLKHHVKITQASSWSDTAVKIHLLEVETEADWVENEILSLESEVFEKRNALKVFAPNLDVRTITPLEPTTTSVQVEKIKSSPAIAWKESELKAKSAMENLKKQSYLPDLFLRFRSFDASQMSPESQELMIGVSLPFLFFWQPKSQTAEASALRIKAEAELQKSKIEFESKLSSMARRAEATLARIKNLDEKLIPRAEQRTKLMKNLSQRTMEGLDQHKSVMLGLLDLKSKRADLRLEHESLIGEIIKLTGHTSEVDLK